MKKVVLFAVLFLTSSVWANWQPPAASDAFQLSAQIVQQQLLLRWQIKPGFLLYKARIHIHTAPNSQLQLGSYSLPAGIDKHDDVLGDYQVYQDQLQLEVPLKNYQPSETRVQVDFQGCSESGFCYPPQRRLLTLQISPFGAQVQAIETVPYTPPKPISAKTENHSLWWLTLSFFGLGILLAFTPCVLPMLPILSSIVIGKRRSTGQAFALSLAYVLGMAVSYAAAGLLAGLLGSSIQAALQSPWVIGLFIVLFIALALSLFGLYDLQLPSRWQTRFNQLGQGQRGGHYLGVAMMGAVSILVVSPCISAPLVAALAYISQSGHTTGGALILFAMGLGMGVPLLIVGTFGGRFIPKAGNWMNTVKKILGVLMLVTAVYLLYRLIPGQYCLILWGLIAIISAVYFGAFKFKQLTRKTLVWFLLGWLWFVTGVVYVVSGTLGNQNPTQPLHSQPHTTALTFIEVKTPAQLQQALMKARGKVVLLDFYADWCVSCKLLEQNVFAQTQIIDALKPVVLLRVDVTNNTADDKKIQQQYKVFAPPTVIVFDQHGNESARLVGEFSQQALLSVLKLR